VDTRDLEAIVADEAQVFFAETYHLEHVQVTCGDHSIPTATVRIRGPKEELICDADHGAGPVDAIYRAINRVIGEPNELIEFSIQAVTEGIDAVGRVTIRIQAEDPVSENGVERRVLTGSSPPGAKQKAKETGEVIHDRKRRSAARLWLRGDRG
jgi:2-isopropylmalate synthase